jgi:hypothetical protein
VPEAQSTRFNADKAIRWLKTACLFLLIIVTLLALLAWRTWQIRGSI